jgi:hypothetical protein
MPGSTYEVQRAGAGCADLTDEACWSHSVLMDTIKYGDVWPVWDWENISPQPDFNDIAAMVRKFQAAGSVCEGGGNDGLACQNDDECPDGACEITAPLKSTCQLQPNDVFPTRPIDFKDIATDVQAFLGTEFSSLEPGPCTCPPSVTCGTTACTSDFDCIGFGDGLCVGSFCADACGRCVP